MSQIPNFFSSPCNSDTSDLFDSWPCNYLLVNPMPKVRGNRSRVHRSEPFETMTDDKLNEVDAPEVTEPVDESSVNESNHSVYKRQQAEWRKMKHQVAQLKKQRKALNKKQREKKKEISKEIRMLLTSMKQKHEEELKSLGIIPDKSRMEIDSEDEVDMD